MFTNIYVEILIILPTSNILEHNFTASIEPVKTIETIVLQHNSRKIIDDNVSITHSFVAHQLPDLVAAITMPIVFIVALFVFD